MIIGISVLLRLIAAASIGPGFDESYYHVFSLNLSAGYFDHPPLVAFTAGIGRWLTGVQANVTLRLGAVLWFVITLAGLYQLAVSLYGRQAGRLAILLPHASPYFFAGAGAFVIPDNALCAVWIWSLFVAFLLRERKINRYAGFAILGVLIGLALLSKYHAVLLPFSFIITCFFDKKLRSWWREPGLYLAFLVALIVFSPCFIWNAQNNWISFAEQFGKGASGGFRFRFDLLGQAIGGQIGYLTPWLAIAIWIGAFRKRKSNADDQWLLPYFLTPVIIFTLLGLTRGILPHWTMPGYIAAFPLAAGAFSNFSKSFRLTFAAIGINLLLVFFIILQAHTGFLPLPEKSDPTLDPFGWEQSIKWLDDNNFIEDDEVIFVHKWFTGGEVTWADGNRHKVVCLGSKPHHFAWISPASEFNGSSGIFITQGRYNLSEKDYREILQNQFNKVVPIELPLLYRGRQPVRMLAWRVEIFYSPSEPPYSR